MNAAACCQGREERVFVEVAVALGGQASGGTAAGSRLGWGGSGAGGYGRRAPMRTLWELADLTDTVRCGKNPQFQGRAQGTVGGVLALVMRNKQARAAASRRRWDMVRRV